MTPKSLYEVKNFFIFNNFFKNDKDKLMFLDYMSNLAILFEYTSNDD